VSSHSHSDRPMLAPCPNSPNCVSTEADDPSKRMEPIPFTGPADAVADRLAKVVERMAGGKVVAREGDRLRVEFTSGLFRFVDDVDLVVDRQAGVVRFRSASRVGYWDMGANRRRMEELRRAFLGMSQ